jgi:hypothetical protein
MTDIQALFDAFAAQAQLRRIESPEIMSLGDLARELHERNQLARVVVNVVATDLNEDGTPKIWEHNGSRHHLWYEPGFYPPGDVSSYRGYYSDLAIELESSVPNPNYDSTLEYDWNEPRSHKYIAMPRDHVVTVGEFVAKLDDAIGETF